MNDELLVKPFLPSASPLVVPLLTYSSSINAFNYCGAK